MYFRSKFWAARYWLGQYFGFSNVTPIAPTPAPAERTVIVPLELRTVIVPEQSRVVYSHLGG